MNSKNLVLAVLAIVLSLGSAIASNFFAPRKGYLKVQRVGEPAVSCTTLNENCTTTTGAFACTVVITGKGTYNLRQGPVTLSDCGPVLTQARAISAPTIPAGQILVVAPGQ